jgi:hypothetical protein
MKMVKPGMKKEAHIGENRNTYTILVKKPEDKRPFGRPCRRRMNNIARSSGKH